jgi:hypothetical protein
MENDRGGVKQIMKKVKHLKTLSPRKDLAAIM